MKKELTEEQKQKRREYSKKYNDLHKERLTEQRKKWWDELKQDPERWADRVAMIKKYHEEHKDDLQRNMKKYYEEHKEEHLEKMRQYHIEHKEEIKSAAWRRKRNADPAEVEKNKERQRAYYQRNKEAIMQKRKQQRELDKQKKLDDNVEKGD